jgi:hypothetical protein
MALLPFLTKSNSGQSFRLYPPSFSSTDSYAKAAGPFVYKCYRLCRAIGLLWSGDSFGDQHVVEAHQLRVRGVLSIQVTVAGDGG